MVEAVRNILRLHPALLCLCASLIPAAQTIYADIGFYESEPNNTPANFHPISGEITLYGTMVGQDQDGFLWTVTDNDARKRWTFTLNGEPGALTIAQVVRLKYAENGVDVSGKRTLFKMGTRNGVTPSIHEDLLFDPEARVESADYDLQTLVDFVREEIAFQPYAGTMRGAAGTLRSRAGSSLDQALLLAHMLKSAGFDAQIVRADLTDDLSRRLLDTSSNAPAPQSTDYFSKAIGQTEDEPSEKRPIEDTKYYKDTQRHAQALLRTLDEAGAKLTSTDATERLLENIRTYFWVQYRESPSQPWQQAHPAYGSAEPPKILEPVEFFAESIPDTYHHQFSMTAWIEQWLGGKIEKHSIMKPWSAPVANLNGKAIRFQNAADGLTRDTAHDLDLALANTNTLTPFVGKALAPGAMAFDLQGRAIDPMAQSGSPAAGIIKTVGDKFATATTDLADRADGKPAMALHSMYLEFTFKRPDGETETRRRYLVPPRENYDEDRSEVLRQLITSYTYMVATGGQPPEFITDQFIEGTISDLEWFRYVALSQAAPEQELELPEEPLSSFPTLHQQWSMERLPVEAGVVRFRSEPALVGIRDGFRDSSTLFSEVDVVWNAVESLRRSGSGWITVPQATLTAGVWDTVLEEIPLSGTQASQTFVASAPIVFDRAQEQGIKLLVMSPDDPVSSKLEALSLDEHEQQFVRRDLDAGYTVVIPERRPDQSPMAAWWRVNTNNGETLGMMGDGYGANMTEYAIGLIVIAVVLAGIFAVGMKYNDCEYKGNMKQKLCCALGIHKEGVSDIAKDDDARDQAWDQAFKEACEN